MKVLVIQGAGMNMRGKAEVEIFGPLTLEQLNAQIRGYADELGIEVESGSAEGPARRALAMCPERGLVAEFESRACPALTRGVVQSRRGERSPMYWGVLAVLAQPGPFNGAWSAATMATHMTWRVTQIQRGLTWAVASGWAVRLPRSGKGPQLYQITPAGLAELRKAH